MAWLGTVTFPTEQDFEDVEYARMVYEEVVKRSLRAGVRLVQKCLWPQAAADA